MPFKYSGNKRRLVKLLPVPPRNTKHIVEPFAGSMAYGMNHVKHNGYLLGFETNTDIFNLWDWLSKSATRAEIKTLEMFLRALPDKTDIPSLDIPPPHKTLARLTSAGVYTGQLSSRKHYAQHKINFDEIIASLERIQSHAKVFNQDFRESLCFGDRCDAMFFIDPPYLGTKANYIDKSKGRNLDQSVGPEDLIAFCSALSAPTIFTYGDGAVDMFPMFDWKVVVERKVPNIRRGGTVIRKEHVALLNWIL